MIKTNHAAVLFFSILLIGIPYCFLGFDVTDYGYNLYEQSRAFNIGFFNTFLNDQQIPLSNYLGGLLQKNSLTGSLVESKFHGLFLYCISAILTYFIVHKCLEFETITQKSKTAIVIFCFSLMALCPSIGGTVLVPTYDTLPMVFYLLLVLFLIEFLKTEKIKYLIFSYVVFFFLVFLKISLVLTLLIPAIVFFVNLLKKRKNIAMQAILFLTTIALAFLYFRFFNSNSAHDLGDSYQYENLMNVYWKHFKKGFPLIFSLAIIIAAGFYFGSFLKRLRFFNVLLIALGFFYFKKLCNSYLDLPSYKSFVNIRYPFTYAVTILFVLLTVVILLWKRKMKTQLMFVFIAALLFPCFLNFGTNTGLQKMAFGIWLMPPLIFLYFEKQNNPFSSVLFMTALFLGFISFLNLYTSYYRDSNQPLLLSSQFEYPKLKYIFTTEERKKSYEEMLLVSQSYIQRNDMVLAYDFNPMFYWLTNTKAYQNLSWPHAEEISKLQKKMDSICKTVEDTPKIIIKTLASTFDREWPVKRLELKNDDSKKKEMIDIAIQNCNPTKVWSNDSFEIWVPKINF